LEVDVDRQCGQAMKRISSANKEDAILRRH